jgi:hypothetical protein
MSQTKVYKKPEHENLGREFLQTFMDFLRINDYILNSNINRIVYDNEEFYITKIKISDRPLNFQMKTYKDIWSLCDRCRPVPEYCDCEDFDQWSDDSFESVETKELKIADLKNLRILGLENLSNENIRYFSQPALHSCWDGGQFEWVMIFNYSQENLNINLELGPKRYLKSERIVGWTGRFLETPIYKIDDNLLVYNYMPDDLYFDQDFYPILKNCLIHDVKKIEYKNRQYEVIDYKCCQVKTRDFSCGCGYASCSPMSKEESITKFPLKCGYRRQFTYSCTPEWYLQVQISACNDYSGFCYRFILNEIVASSLESK